MKTVVHYNTTARLDPSPHKVRMKQRVEQKNYAYLKQKRTTRNNITSDVQQKHITS